MHIVMVEPEIPGNTGNVARLCAANHITLGSLTLAIKENRCEASKMAYFFVKFFIFFLSNV